MGESSPTEEQPPKAPAATGETDADEPIEQAEPPLEPGDSNLADAWWAL